MTCGQGFGFGYSIGISLRTLAQGRLLVPLNGIGFKFQGDLR